jgi:hypothetical protein
MAKEEDIYKRPVKNITELRIEAARIAHASGSGENPIEVLNGLIEAECRAEMFRARYGADGQTLSATALQLAQDAGRNANHRRTLARNLNKASGVPRPQEVEAHHIVSAHDIRADLSRKILFAKGIGINDADNGNYQPSGKGAKVTGAENAAPHRNIHTGMYHLNVYRRLLAASNRPTADVRGALRTIKAELNAGTFIY